VISIVDVPAADANASAGISILHPCYFEYSLISKAKPS